MLRGFAHFHRFAPHFARRASAWNRRAVTTAGLACLTVLAVLVLGYHPFAEDGGIYAAAIQARLDPHLFPHGHAWVTAHTRFALFVPAVVATTRFLHLPSAAVQFLLYVAGIYALLAAAAHLARTCCPGTQLPWLATLTLTAAAGLPVAGTALYAVDPYCTARTITTPLLLIALSFALRKRWLATSLCWAATAAMHPLMALWAAVPLVFLGALLSKHPRRWLAALTVFAFLLAALLAFASQSETEATRAVAHTRAYWFPAQWRWYEWAGAIAPCILLAALRRPFRLVPQSPLSRLTIAIVATTAFASALAVVFCREGAASLAIARLQPLRSLHLIFLAFLIAGSSLLQQKLRKPSQTLLAIGTCAVLAICCFTMQRSLYPHTAHLELPGKEPSNAWEQAFVWCRNNTPPDALFALDANYINGPGEDGHGFRAVALHSTLPDYVKDAGIAAVLPSLTASWQSGVAATHDLNRQTDAQRRARLLPLDVTWIVLPASGSTSLRCPYHNGAAQVCQLR